MIFQAKQVRGAVFLDGSAASDYNNVYSKKETALRHASIVFQRLGRPFRTMRPGRLIVLVFLFIILLGAGLLCLPAASRSGEPTPFLTSLFTATSATCVTGLIRVDTGTHWAMFGQVVILLLIQIGGLGFMTIACLFSSRSAVRSACGSAWCWHRPSAATATAAS